MSEPVEPNLVTWVREGDHFRCAACGHVGSQLGPARFGQPAPAPAPPLHFCSPPLRETP